MAMGSRGPPHQRRTLPATPPFYPTCAPPLSGATRRARADLPTARRDIFLDAYDDKEFIRGQVRELVRLARRKGSAIGIGHPYRSTLSVLEEMRNEILESGVEWVPVSQLTVQAYRADEATTR